ncbi:MAG: hypothetical protein NVSMB2_20990 [Chloroflexota bacterium]
MRTTGIVALECGLDTFGDVTMDAAGNHLPYDQVIRNVVDERILAEQVGVDGITSACSMRKSS